MNKNDIRYAVVKATFYSQLLLESLDEVSHTPVFKHSLKFKVKQAEKELEKATNKLLDQMYGENEEFLVNLQKHTDELMTRLCKLGIDELPLVNAILEEYENDSDNWKENLTIQFTKLK